jgi:hypothetical protein
MHANLTGQATQPVDGAKLQLAFKYSLWSAIIFYDIPFLISFALKLAKRYGIEWFTLSEEDKERLASHFEGGNFWKFYNFIEKYIDYFKDAIGIVKLANVTAFSACGGYFTDPNDTEILHDYNLTSSKIATCISGVSLATFILYDVIWVFVKKKLAHSSRRSMNMLRESSVTDSEAGSYSSHSFMNEPGPQLIMRDPSEYGICIVASRNICGCEIAAYREDPQRARRRRNSF